MPKLFVKTTIELNVPEGTHSVKTESGHITLVRKDGNIFRLFTCCTEEAHRLDLLDENLWTGDYTRSELEAILRLKR